MDWQNITSQKIADRVIKKVKPGSIVLFHNNAQYVEEYLPIILEKLTSEGYEIIPISELIHKDNYYIDHTGRQFKKN